MGIGWEHRGLNEPQAKSAQPATARPGQLESFARIAERAREVLRERGLNESQVETELGLASATPSTPD